MFRDRKVKYLSPLKLTCSNPEPELAATEAASKRRETGKNMI